MRSLDSKREPFDLDAYKTRVRNGPCFICAMLAGNPEDQHRIVHRDDTAIVFLNKYPTLYGYTLAAPSKHLGQVTGDFKIDEYLALQQVVFCVAEAVREETQAERVYILSLGSQQGNSHVHWHIAPLPPDVPYEEQQLEALKFERGVLRLSYKEEVELAGRLRQRMEAQSKR